MKTLLPLFATLLLCQPALATDVSLLVGYQWNADFELSDTAASSPASRVDGEPGDDVGLDGGAALSLALDFDTLRDPKQRIGLFLSHYQGSFERNAGLGNRDMSITHLHFTGLNYYPEGNWEHFVLAGIGASYFDPDDPSLDADTRFSMQIGGGTNYRLSEKFLLRLEARWIGAFFDSSAAGLCSGGCTIAVKSDTYNQVQLSAGLMFRF